MIIGSGDIALALQTHDNDDLVFFASGVSNSQETDEEAYCREYDLLMSVPTNRHLVYFSSLSVFSQDTRYTRHKRQIEELVKKRFWRYTIMRLGNITWGRNPHLLINYLRSMHHQDRLNEVEVQDVYRYPLDMQEFLHWVCLIPKWSCEINVCGKRMKVVDIIKEYVTND